MWQQWLGWLVAGLLGLCLSFVIVRSWLRAVRRRWVVGRRIAHAQRGERLAERLLVERGYAIEAVQPRLVYTLRCDQEEYDVSLRADLLVRRNGERFVVDVKTGEQAPRLSTAATRRQLLEYRAAYGVDGVLLVDIDRRRIRHVDFLFDFSLLGEP